MAKQKRRLDQIVQEYYPHYSRQQIQSWIMQGKVLINDQPVLKPGTMIAPDAHIVCKGEVPKFVSRAGFKLEKALDHFGVDVTGLTALDAGISTGGFTDCLLQRGAKKVYGIDVGYGQVHEKIRTDSRVILKERTNLRALPDFDEQVNIVTLDLSFISVLKVMDVVSRVLADEGHLVVLIKPQFEASRGDVGRGGIIKDPAIHQKVIDQVVAGIQEYGFMPVGVIESPILGGSGNKEFLAYFRKNVREHD